MTREQIEDRMNELTRKYLEAHDPEIPYELYKLARELEKLEKEALDYNMSKEQYPVTVEIEGNRYTGFYTVGSGVVTVESDWGERSTEAVGPQAERTARLLLLEILRRAKVPVTLPPPRNVL